MKVASFYGAFWGLLAHPVFYGVPLGVLCAVLGGVRTGGGFWVAGARFRRSGARSGRSMGAALGLGCILPVLGSGGAFWGMGRGFNIGNRKPNAGGAFGSGRGVLGRWGWDYAPKISQRARKSSPLQSSP